MSELRAALRAFPALLRVGFASAIAYRAELIVWILSTTMPLIMLALFTSVARDAPMGRFGTAEFTAYFLATFIVRQLTGAWIAWQLNFEIRDGTLGMRLLRPIHPLISYAGEAIATIPLRGLIALPLAFVTLFFVGKNAYTHDPVLWLLWTVSIVGGWVLALLTNFAIGILAFFVQSSLKLIDIWLAIYFVFSGYIVPVELFPSWLRTVCALLPFRYQLALPVELMTGALSHHAAAELIAAQFAHIGIAFAVSFLLWRKGLRRFEAYGG